jgi:hypothetical protein
VGVLFLTNYVANFIGSDFLESIIYAPDYLFNLYSNKTQVIIAELLELICGAAVVGIAVMMFPILKKHNENIARGYFGFRIIEIAMMIVSIIISLSLLILSQEYVKAGAPNASSFQTLGTLTVAGRYWAFKMVVIFYILGALMFFCLLYQSKLIPRFISVWGLIGVTLMLTATMLEIFGYNNFSYTGFYPGMIFYLPGGLNEPFLGIWLIVKGFNSSAIDCGSAKTDINEIK